MFNHAGKGFRPYSSATHNIITDGNSIAAYVGGTLTGQGLATTIEGLPVLAGSGISVQGFATGGHNFTDMIAGIAAVRGAYVSGKINILYFDEFTNEVYGANQTAAQTINNMLAYMNAASSGGLKWNFRCFTTIPRGVGDSRNSILVQVDDLLRANWRTYGLGGIIDRRLQGSPWRLSGYTQADFNSIASYYTANERQGSGHANENIHTHPSDLGYALQRSMLDMDLRRLGYWR